jgi:hypothetical protein
MPPDITNFSALSGQEVTDFLASEPWGALKERIVKEASEKLVALLQQQAKENAAMHRQAISENPDAKTWETTLSDDMTPWQHKGKGLGLENKKKKIYEKVAFATLIDKARFEDAFCLQTEETGETSWAHLNVTQAIQTKLLEAKEKNVEDVRTLFKEVAEILKLPPPEASTQAPLEADTNAPIQAIEPLSAITLTIRKQLSQAIKSLDSALPDALTAFKAEKPKAQTSPDGRAVTLKIIHPNKEKR